MAYYSLFGKSIDKQIKAEADESGVHGACITVSNFIKMIENHQNGIHKYSHEDIRKIFSIDRQVTLNDVSSQCLLGYNVQHQSFEMAAEQHTTYGE